MKQNPACASLCLPRPSVPTAPVKNFISVCNENKQHDQIQFFFCRKRQLSTQKPFLRSSLACLHYYCPFSSEIIQRKMSGGAKSGLAREWSCEGLINVLSVKVWRRSGNDGFCGADIVSPKHARQQVKTCISPMQVVHCNKPRFVWIPHSHIHVPMLQSLTHALTRPLPNKCLGGPGGFLLE